MREFCEKYFLFVAILAVAAINYGNGYWNFHWFWKWNMLMLVLTVFVAYWLGRKIHWAVGLCFLSTISGAFRTFGFLDLNRWPPYSKVLPADYRAAALGMTALLFLWFFYLIPKRYFRTLIGIFIVINLWTLAMVYYQAYMGLIPYLRAGVFGNASMNACFIGFTAPLILFRTGWISKLKHAVPIRLVYAALCITAFLLANNSMGFAVFGAVVAAKCFQEMYFRQRYALLVLMVALPCLVGCVGYLNEGIEFFNHSGRFDVWALVGNWWYKFADKLSGTGVGTAYALVPWIQYQANPGAARHDSFIWLHNDWFQLLVEEGFVGLLSYLALYIVCLKRAFKSAYLFPCMIGLGVCALANYPFRLPIHAFTGMAFVMMCLSYKPRRKYA